jgi:hypothetical protein
MPRYRPDVDKRVEAKIKRELARGKSIEKTAIKYGVSFTLARQIKNGNRVRPPRNYTPPGPPPKIPEGQLCTYCGVRPKKPGNRFLCAQCAAEN